MLSKPHRAFLADLTQSLPTDRCFTDPLQTLAFGTDASFYRLVPQVVVRTANEDEVSALLRAADRHNVPVTFRAAGTSLSGQAISDSVLAVAGSAWTRYDIVDGGRRIRLQPGVIGAQANRYLAPYGRKIGPDPASINAAMIGGIAANNASGMCCGTAENSYQTVAALRVILADGTRVDTADRASRDALRQSHGHLLDRLARIAAEVQANSQLAERIRRKFKIKNTTGYSLNALVDFSDPFDILTHLMIGSEGTLGFMSEITYDTVVDHPDKASALMFFADMAGACRAAAVLRSLPTSAVELMDRAALRSVDGKPGMPAVLSGLSPETVALLVEIRGASPTELAQRVATVAEALKCSTGSAGGSDDSRINRSLTCESTVLPIRFTDRVDEFTRLWNIRKGLFPAVGAVRRTGTTVIIEDVAFPIDHLADAALALQDLFVTHAYREAIIFGHAREGNLHFVFTQDFGRQAEVDRYSRFMDDLSHLVVERFDGSLKAEHGTGRNMAPFVEMEWGREATELMRELKALFDPKGLLNPGVILNPRPQAHLENLKPLPAAHPIIDKCIECGFCEAVCPSRNLTLTPRQRITIQREIARLERGGQTGDRLRTLRNAYRYWGEQTCAADGLCALSCPVDIDTGKHTKHLRRRLVRGAGLQRRADLIAGRFDRIAAAARVALRLTAGLEGLLGADRLERVSRMASRLSRGRLPAWNRWLPAAAPPPATPAAAGDAGLDVVYFPACVSRTMGAAQGDPDSQSLHEVTLRVLQRAGCRVRLPRRLESLCCGTAFESKGFFAQADTKAYELELALLEASHGGRLPILCDTSPCLERMQRCLNPRLELFEPVAFIQRFLLPRLTIHRRLPALAVHIPCSARKLGLETAFADLAAALAETVILPDGVSCCGMAGDRGLLFPELPRSALAPLAPAVQGRSPRGVSTSRTCEIGLSLHSGIPYRSVIYALDECTAGAAA
jgi:D-lactate dehydrogenase